MIAPTPNSPSPEVLTIVTWNILHDVTRTKAGLIQSQLDRAPSLASNLVTLRDQLHSELDVVALQEVHKTAEQHNGVYMSQELGYGNGYWFVHNKPRPNLGGGRTGEHIGVFGARIDHADFVELGDNRRAVISHIGNVAVVNIHTRARFKNRELQKEQVKVVLERVADEESVAFMGDFNSWGRGMARRAVEAEGFDSAFTILRKRHPKTFPTPAYRGMMYGKARFIAPSVALDEIYVRGMAVHDAGSFTGDSDHAGLWAKMEPLV